MSGAPLLLPMHSIHTGPAGTGSTHLQRCKKLFLPQHLLLTFCSSRAAGKAENGGERRGKTHVGGTRRSRGGDWPKPFAVNPVALLTQPEGKAAEAAAVVSPCSDRPVAQTEQQCQRVCKYVVRVFWLLEIPSLLLMQRKGLMPYIACHAKTFASP